MAIKFIPAQSLENIEIVRSLFQEYANALGFDLSFQDFNKEIARLPGEYALPNGRLYIAYWNKMIAGCIALRAIDQCVCEMKRMYVRPEYRRRGIGKAMAQLIIKEAKTIGYQKIRLDTVPAMKAARHIYKKLGFKRIEAYRFNPLPGALYMELVLKSDRY